MFAHLGWLIAAVSGVVCLLLWFWLVKQIVKERRSAVNEAEVQFHMCQEQCSRSRDDPDAAAVLKRSVSIYHQAVDIYNRTLHKPWIHLPAVLMGFHDISRGGVETIRL